MGEQTASSKAGAKVVVACKLPNGLILRLMHEVEHSEPVMGGGFRVVKQSRPTGDQVVIKGNAVAHGKTPRHPIILPPGMEGQDEGVPFTEGYALTTGVSKEFWDKWLAQNEELDAVKNRLIFACDTEEAATRRAQSNIKVRSGMEPINPEGDSRAPRRVTKADRKTLEA